MKDPTIYDVPTPAEVEEMERLPVICACRGDNDCDGSCQCPKPRIMCERCQGNGEIVVDWEAYLCPTDLAAEEKSVAECPDCYGYGWEQ